MKKKALFLIWKPLSSDMKSELSSNLSGNEVYHTNSLICLLKNMLCGNLDCWKGFGSITVGYDILRCIGRSGRC